MFLGIVSIFFVAWKCPKKMTDGVVVVVLVVVVGGPTNYYVTPNLS